MAQTKVEVGSQLPEFTLKDDKGKDYTPSQWLGQKNVVIYFYPKDDTPGCTKEGCSFRDHFLEFQELDAVVIGVSSDGQKSHEKFKEKYGLTYTLLSDTEKKARKIFGVPSSMFGIIPGRVTYVFNKTGKCILVINSQTHPEKHIEKSLEVLSNGLEP